MNETTMNEAMTNDETTTSYLSRDFTPRATGSIQHDPAFRDALLAFTDAENELYTTPFEEQIGTPEAARAAALAHQKASQAAEMLFSVIDQLIDQLIDQAIDQAVSDFARRAAEGDATGEKTTERSAA